MTDEKNKKLSDPNKSKQPKKACTENCPPSEEETTLKVEVKSYFWIRKENGILMPTSGEDWDRRIRNIGAIEVLDASVTLVKRKKDQEVIPVGLTRKTSVGGNGKKYAPAEFKKVKLPEGTYTIDVTPPESRRSYAPAGKHTKGKTSNKGSDLTARMYRAVRLFVNINNSGKAVAAWVPWVPNNENSKPEEQKPADAMPWDWNYANAWTESRGSDTVYVDLKPDWWSGWSNRNKDRAKRMKRDKVQCIDLISLHNTGGCSNGDENIPKYGTKSIGAAIGWGMNSPGPGTLKSRGYAGHYYVDLDGHVVKIYDEKTLVTMHTDGTWLGKSSNTRSIGIETTRLWKGFQEWNENGHTTKPLDHLRQPQFDSIVRLIKDLQSMEGQRTEKEVPIAIPPHRIIGHSDGGGAHGGTCPGCDYWWELLEKKGLGMIFPDNLTGNTVPDPYPNEYPAYVDWFKNKDNKLVKDNATDVVSKIIQDLKDIGYEVRGTTFQSAAFAIERFQRHFYSGSRYHFRYWTLEERDKWQKGDLDGRPGQTPSTIEVDRRLALGIMAVANFVRQSDRQWDQMQQLRKSQQRLEQLDLKLKL